MCLLRRLLLGAVIALLWLIGGSTPAATPLVGAQAAGNVGLVIAYGTGQVTEYCFSVPASGISGLDLLQRAGVPVRTEVVSLGAEICAVNGVGCLDTGQPCYCQCQGSPCVYWQYAQWRNGRWVGSNLGASSTVVRPGSIEGWGWSGNPPPPAGVALCATATPATAAPLPLPATTTPRPAPATARPHPATATSHPTLPAGATPRPTLPPTRTAQPAAGPIASARPTLPATATDTPPPAVAATISPPIAPVTVPATPLPTDIPSTIAPATAPPAPIPTDTAPAVATAPTPQSDRRSQTADLPPSYWAFGVLALGLAALIGWARRTRLS